MTNLRRYHDNIAYFLTSVTKDRESVFSRGKSAALLEAMFFYYRQVMRFYLYAYVIMPDHFHLICQPSSLYDISEIMNAIKGDFARQYNILRRKPGQKIWQIRFYDRGIRSEAELKQKINYTHDNPVRKGLVANAADWNYSSAKWYDENTAKIKIMDSYQ
ncbi:MAG: transposase [Pseudomonadota bacterium]